MRVILDIDDDVLADMQMYADVMQKELSELVQGMFVRYIREPKQMIYDTYNEDANNAELMQNLLYQYLTECIEDMNAKEESCEHNVKMVEVFKLIRDDIVDDDRAIAKLYRAFKAAK